MKSLGALLLLVLFSQFRLVPADARIPDTHTLPQETHIIYVRPRPGTELPGLPERESWYTSLLADIFNSTHTAKDRINHSYRQVVTGFSASLTEPELERVAGQNWFVYSSPEATHKRQTTRTGEFLGLHQELGGPVDVWKRASFGEGMIIGVLDSGIDTEHPSFHDDGTLPPPPAKWKGACDLDATQGLCSNKIVGARSLVTPCRAPCNNFTFGYDDVGHGTLVASIAAGSPVKNASAYGQAKGTAVGMAPRAHLAIYKVTRMDLDNVDEDAFMSDVLAGIDAAVEDGVDVISISLAADQLSFADNAMAIGALSAVAKGIPVIISAGNAGPSANSLENFAPWTLIVGASTIDRIISAVVKLGSGLEIEGQFHNQKKAQVGHEMLPLVFKGSCLVEEEMMDVKGKVVLCEGEDPNSSYGQLVWKYHGAALVYMNPEETGSTISPGDTQMDSGSYVTFSDGNKIKAYQNSTANPTATIIFKGTIIGTPRAPVVASFSSRGPNRLSPGILKPDIIGPGVDIVVANKGQGQRENPFFQVDGTSVACPHLSGIAALLKGLHPDWSPAAIMSALMTSADVLDNKGNRIRDEKGLPADLFAIGAGHVNVSRAADPGLVYNISHNEYVSYLCGLTSYTVAQLQAITNNNTLDCSTMLSIREEDLNYPTISVPLPRRPFSDFAITRTLTNVGDPNSVYQAEIDMPVGVLAVVTPQTLPFSETSQQLVFSIIFMVTAEAQSDSNYAQGEIRWVSGDYVVRSPISIRFHN